MGSGSVGAGATTNSNPLYIGYNGTYYYNGAMDDVRIFSQALTTSEVQTLAAPTVVTVAATDAQASELGDTGNFTITRTGTTGDLTVYYTLSGSAANGIDYRALSGVATIPNGSSTVDVTIAAVDSALGNSRTAVVTLAAAPSAQYELGAAVNATASVNLVSTVNLRGLWKLDDGTGTTAVDSSPNPLNGTLNNGPTWAGGYVNGGLHFDGVNDNVTTAYSTKFDFGTGPFTISTWVKLDAGDTLDVGECYPLINTGYGGPTSHRLFWNLNGAADTNGSRFGVSVPTSPTTYYDGVLTPAIGTAPTLNDHNWHQVMVMRDELSVLRFYLDGRVVGAYAHFDFPISSSGPLVIGYQADNGYGHFKGTMDDIRVYGRALSNTEIQALSTRESVSIAASAATASETGPVNGAFTVTRNQWGYAANDLTVYYTITGTASNGADYNTIEGSVVIPAWQKSATITIAPVDDALFEGAETVQLTLISASYTVSGSGTTVTINDDLARVAPSRLTATTVSSSQINLSWTDNSDNETGFKIERAPDNGGVPGTFAQIDTVGANVTTYNNTTGLTDGTKYWYQVRAYNTVAGDSDYTNQPNAITTLAAPTGLGATAISTSEIDLGWTDHSDAETGFKIERAPDVSGTPGTFTQIDTVGANVTTYNNTTGLSNGTTYWYRVRTYNAGGDSGYTSNASAKTYTLLLSDGFETNFNNWTDGGTTDWDRATSQKYSGSYSAHAGSSDNDLISDNLNTAGYSYVKIEFQYRDDDIDTAEAYLQLFNGSSYANRQDLGIASEDAWHSYSVTLSYASGDSAYFVSNFRLKFEATSLDSGENLWIDDVIVTAW